jgi:Ala-tRNA(Pro) deacylase
MFRRLDVFLEIHEAKYEEVKHPGALAAQEQAAADQVPGSSFAKVVIVKDRSGLAMVVLPSSSDIDLGRLKGVIGRGPVRLATVEEMLRVFSGCELGAIPPFGRLFGLPTVVEHALVTRREFDMPAGDHRTAIRMRASEFLRLADPRVGRFALESRDLPLAREPRAGVASPGAAVA